MAPSEETPLHLQELEIMAIQKALSRTGGNKTQAAELLGIDKSTLHRKIRRYDIQDPPSKS
jgi:two-component system, NtrC family, response regulator AtoC